MSELHVSELHVSGVRMTCALFSQIIDILDILRPPSLAEMKDVYPPNTTVSCCACYTAVHVCIPTVSQCHSVTVSQCLSVSVSQCLSECGSQQPLTVLELSP